MARSRCTFGQRSAAAAFEELDFAGARKLEKLELREAPKATGVALPTVCGIVGNIIQSFFCIFRSPPLRGDVGIDAPRRCKHPLQITHGCIAVDVVLFLACDGA